MKKVFANLKMHILKVYELIKELDQLPMRNMQGEFYEENKKTPRVPRKNNVSLEDLRPRRED
ncbi:MAG: hypothetical protein HUU57_09620 [Bdellovibrio sp.]|nr:hypothetical protein [Bdellovibrio sp.]